MKRSYSSLSLVWALVGTGVIGLSLSMVLTSDQRWLEWHISRLGEGSGLAAAIFNFSLSLAGLILVLITMRMTDEIRHRNPNSSVTALRALLLLAAVCWIGVACFPFDRFKLIHWIFGYTQFFVIGFLMLRLKHLTVAFSARTHAIGLMSALVVAILMGLHHTIHLLPLLTVELVGELAVFVWLLSMAYDQKPSR